VLVGPSHFVPFEGLATSSAEAFATPLGLVRVDTEAIRKLVLLPHVAVLDLAHTVD
jgi:MEMO1 family protein